MERIDRILTDIARTHLGCTTLATRHSDRLDFHELSVWQVKAALEAAFQAGPYSTAGPDADSPLPARFDAYEIHGVREYGEGDDASCEQVPDEPAEFWSLYGHIPGQGVDCIGDFATREHAEEVFARITGRRYTETPIRGRRQA